MAASQRDANAKPNAYLSKTYVFLMLLVSLVRLLRWDEWRLGDKLMDRYFLHTPKGANQSHVDGTTFHCALYRFLLYREMFEKLRESRRVQSLS